MPGPGLNDLQRDMITMRRYLAHALDDVDPAKGNKSVDAFLSEIAGICEGAAGLLAFTGTICSHSPDDVAEEEKARRTPEGKAERAILDSKQRFSSVKCPMLVFFAYPHDLPQR